MSVFECPGVPERKDVTFAVAKPPRPAVSFTAPLAPTDYEAVMGVQALNWKPVRFAALRWALMILALAFFSVSVDQAFIYYQF